MKRAVLIWLIAGCGRAPAAAPDGANLPDGALPADASDATPDAPVDTCAPSGAFATDLPPGVGADTTRRHAVLQVSAAGVRIYASELYQNGSFFDANLVELARTAPGMWTSGGIANGGIGLSIASQLAVTEGADPCVAYSNDYDGTLHLHCAQAVDRTLAPAIQTTLAIADGGATKQLVYGDNHDALVWQPFDTDPGTAEPIDTAWEFGPSAVAIAPDGDTHVVYVVHTSDGGRTIEHAVRHAGTWTREMVDSDRWTGSSSSDGSSLSFVLDGNDPVIAYHHLSTHSLRLARRSGSGFTVRTLVAADPGFANDEVGAAVVLRRDCVGRLLIVYQRDLSTDAHPNVGLAYARITDTGLEDKAFLPMTASTAYAFYGGPYSLGFSIDAAGHQYVAAQLSSVYGPAVYFASR